MTNASPQHSPPPRTTHLLYLHGFRSSPQSAKARRMAEWAQRDRPDLTFWCPQLPPSPEAAANLMAQGTAEWPQASMAVIGSSLGGYYAAWLAQRCRCPSVLLNPAVNPARDLENYTGNLTQWHNPQEHFYFAPEFVGELRALDVAGQTLAAPQMAILAKGDEVLNWREMAARYAQARISLLEGGDHALSDFESHLPAIARFLNGF